MTPLQAWLTAEDVPVRGIGEMMVLGKAAHPRILPWADQYLWVDLTSGIPFLFHEGEFIGMNFERPTAVSRWALHNSIQTPISSEYEEWLASFEIVQEVSQFQSPPHRHPAPMARKGRYEISLSVPWAFPYPGARRLDFFTGTFTLEWAIGGWSTKNGQSSRVTVFSEHEEYITDGLRAEMGKLHEMYPRPYTHARYYETQEETQDD